MPVETTTQPWIDSPAGRQVSAQRMQRGGRMFSLYDAANMDVDAFNSEAAKYGVHMDENDAPIDRLVKYAVFLSRRDKDGSAVMGNQEYIATALHAASRKAQEPFKSFYNTLTHDAVDFVGEILAFKERIETGADKGKYVAERMVFNTDAELKDAGKILVAPEGWQRVLGINGYPVETSEDAHRIESIEIPGLDDNDASGYWYVGNDPVGQERIVLRDPIWYVDRLLDAGVRRGRSCSHGRVGALRSRRAA
ncbi:MAG: hypothetical protein FJY76_00505 [Candidatus Aenigmarchaeota archaeon]|nr:hypothetical protein [Candidatus Aenigmarchaeota archaeon]